MARVLTGLSILLIALGLLWATPALAQPAASDRVVKTACATAIGYDDLERLKADLLLRAKREAANELFGELIAAATTVENLVVTADQIRVQSLGLIRVEGSAAYANGPNLAEVCVTVTAYVTAQDRAQFVAETIDGRACVTDAALSVRELRSRAETAARITALAEYDVLLAGYEDDAILPLLRRIDYSESGLLAGTETYCATVAGAVVPIEVLSFLSPDRNLTVRPETTSRSGPTPTPASTSRPVATPTRGLPTSTPKPQIDPDGSHVENSPCGRVISLEFRPDNSQGHGYWVPNIDQSVADCWYKVTEYPIPDNQTVASVPGAGPFKINVSPEHSFDCSQKQYIVVAVVSGQTDWSVISRTFDVIPDHCAQPSSK